MIVRMMPSVGSRVKTTKRLTSHRRRVPCWRALMRVHRITKFEFRPLL